MTATLEIENETQVFAPAKAPKKLTAKAVCETHRETLSAMKTHGELFRFGKENGFDSRAGFTAFKKGLAGIGVDYDAIKSGIIAGRAEERESKITHEVTLYTDAKARCERFAICDRSGEVVWFGKFFDGEGSEQSAAELESAKKAIWFASKVKEALGCEAIRLNLIVDAEWLTFANRVQAGESKGGKSRVLGELANRFNIELDVTWIAGTSNPADRWTTASGYKSWKDNILTTLAMPVVA